MRNINPFGLRLQPEHKARLEEAAKQNKRSLNAEISARLEATLFLDDLMEKSRMGTFQEVPGVLDALMRENAEYADNAAQFKRVITEQFSRLLDDRIDLLESRLLSLPGSSFGKSLKR